MFPCIIPSVLSNVQEVAPSLMFLGGDVVESSSSTCLPSHCLLDRNTAFDHFKRTLGRVILFLIVCTIIHYRHSDSFSCAHFSPQRAVLGVFVVPLPLSCIVMEI